MRAIWSVRAKCSHRCVSLKETSLKPVQILKHTTKNSAEQTAMRTKCFKHIAIQTVQVHLLGTVQAVPVFGSCGSLSVLSLFFLEFLCFFPLQGFPFFLSMFPFFSSDYRGSVGTKKILVFLVVFLAFFSKKKNKERKDRVPLQKRFFCVFQYSLTGKNGSGSGFGSWKTVPAVPVPLSVSGNGSDGSGFPVLVRFLSHPDFLIFFLHMSGALKSPCGCNPPRPLQSPKSGKPGNPIFRVQKYPFSPPSWDP